MTSGIENQPRLASVLEVSLISLTLFSLPLYEAPKNFFSILLIVVWLLGVIWGRGIGRRSPFDLLVFGLIAILWIAPLLSEFKHDITPLNSAPRWTLLGVFVLLVVRLDYSRGQLIAILSSLMIGGVMAVTESIWVWILSDNPYPEFRSVGHVNHSSMYSLIPLAVGFGVLPVGKNWLRGLGLVAIISTLVFLPPSRSLVGGVATIAILLVGVSALLWRYYKISNLIFAIATLALVLAGMFMTAPADKIRNELVWRVTSGDIFSKRDKILNSALAVWDEHPLVGTGWFSFGMATSEQEVRRALARDGLEYSRNTYAHLPHGHNLWTTILIERGLFGIIMVTTLLIFYFWIFIPIVFSGDRLQALDRGVALSAVLVALGFVVAGLGNTTMMNEHGHSGMALIAVVYGYLRGQGVISPR